MALTFDEAASKYAQLRSERDAGRLGEAEFVAAVQALQVQDQGRHWTLDPATGGWLYYDGVAWVPQAAAGQGKAAQLMAERGMEAPRLNETQQKKWGFLSIAAGFVGAIIWLIYSHLGEGKDWGTFFLMLALPISLAIFRKPIDRLLLPLLPTRKRIPRLVLIALGLAAPYIVAWLLYNRGPFIGGLVSLCFRIGGSLAGLGNFIGAIVPSLAEYGYMRWTVVLGPLVAYLIMRTPQESAGAGTPTAARAGVGPAMASFLLATRCCSLQSASLMTSLPTRSTSETVSAQRAGRLSLRAPDRASSPYLSMVRRSSRRSSRRQRVWCRQPSRRLSSLRRRLPGQLRRPSSMALTR